MTPVTIARAAASRALAEVLVRLWTRALVDGHGRAIRVAGGPRLQFDPESDDGRKIYRDAGDRITGINEETRRRVAAYVTRARLVGMSIDQLAALIEADPSGAFSRARARTIARTESGTALNRGSLLGYRQSGRVTKVRVYDGDGCGWTSHDSGDTAHGSIRDLDDAEAHVLAHPNCRRAFSAVVDPGRR